MTKFKILIEGYARQIKGGWKASSSVILIESNEIRIIVDPGINRTLLLGKLKEQKIKTSDIEVVFLTHYHPDHILLASLFKRAVVLDGDTIYQNDLEKKYKGIIPKTEIQVVATPGHAYEHCSLFFPSEQGIIVVAGDVFWWTAGEKQVVDIYKDDPFIKDKKLLVRSRKRLLKLADWIIPGHGKMFKSLKV